MVFPADVVSFTVFVRLCVCYITKRGLLVFVGATGIFPQCLAVAGPVAEHVCGARLARRAQQPSVLSSGSDHQLIAGRLVSSSSEERRKRDLLFRSSKLLNVNFAPAAEVHDLPAGKKSPVSNHSGSGGALEKFGITNAVGLSATNRCNEPR